jgi:hypothetical protein
LSDPDERLSEVGWRVPVAPSRNGGALHPEAPGASLDVVFAGGATPNPPEMLESARMRANFATEQAHPYYAYPYGRAESSRSAKTRTFG